MPKLNIYIDNFILADSIINAYTIVDGNSIDFSINRDEFETFCDDREFRNWNNDTYTGWGGWNENNGTTPWEDIYEGFEQVYDFLQDYIQHLYATEPASISYEEAYKLGGELIHENSNY